MIAPKIIKYSEKNSRKEESLYTRNSKTLRREFKDLWKWRSTLYPRIWQLYTGSVKRCGHFLPKPGSLELNLRLSPRAQQLHSQALAQGRWTATQTHVKCWEQRPAHSKPTWTPAGTRSRLRGPGRSGPTRRVAGSLSRVFLKGCSTHHLEGLCPAFSWRAAPLVCFRFASAERAV